MDNARQTHGVDQFFIHVFAVAQQNSLKQWRMLTKHILHVPHKPVSYLA